MSTIKRPIEDHGIIGDLRTCALVANDGTIDYLCWPELDSPSIFSALLESDDAGLFSLAPEWQDMRRQQLYLPDTNILQTRWLGAEGIAEITDYMPICDDEKKMPRLIRRVKMVRGSAWFNMRCAPRHDYARAETQAAAAGDFVAFTAPNQPALRLAATFGLPEELGGVRNWDYRASWIRDASFSMYTLMRLGYVDEAKHFTRWVGRCVENSHHDEMRLQVIYRLDSGTELHEVELLNLSGYTDSRPVRIGNDAWQQTQLDIYGELM
nr:glucoamylase [Candidatus Pantoea persica]